MWLRRMLLSVLLLHSLSWAAARPGAATSNQWSTYTTQGAVQSDSNDGGDNGLGFTSRLSLTNDQQLKYGPSFKDLRVTVQPQTAERLCVKITPEVQQQQDKQQQARWVVPESIVPRPGVAQGLSSADLLYEVQQPLAAAGQNFALTVTRKATGQPVFNTQGHSFLFKDQFIELTTSVPQDSDLYGLGETALPGGLLLPRNGEVVTMWARDSAPAETNINVYGTHPFYLQLNKDGTAQGVVLLNSNGMDVMLNKTSLTFRAIGGIVELYLFMGPTPEEVIQQYHAVVGKPMMPPYWALGAHQGKWGYTLLSDLEAVVSNYSAAGLPLEGLWVDIEMFNNRFQVFTFDQQRYPAAEMRKFVEKLHAAGQHWAPIFNPAITVQKGYRAYEEGNAHDLWIKDVSGQPYKGQVWPGEVVYPSYLGDKASKWLKSQMQNMHDQVPFDGMWLDMTEAANFCGGMQCEVPTDNKTAMWALTMPTPLDFNATLIIQNRVRCHMKCQWAPASNKIANPPYNIHNFGWKEGISNNDDDRVKARDSNFTAPLDTKAISVTATHPDGTLEYNAHNLYGTSMARHFHNTYKDITGKRVFLLTRSTSPGAGRYTGHWTGDTKVTWEAFQQQTAAVLSANMWGLAMTGADICGYGIEGLPKMSDVQLQELCIRWTSAGAFYPFTRNHMNYFTKPHEPYRWASLTAAAKKVYELRYKLMTYMYGSMFLAHRKGGTLARPVFFTDPSDLAARNATWQWMIGEALMVSPVTTNLTSVINPHFTAGAWYNVWTYDRLDSKQGGQSVRMDVPLGDIALHLRGGTIVPMQQYAPVTRDVRVSPVKLVVALPAAAAAGDDTGSSASSSSPSSAAARPVLPYAGEEQCASVRARSPGQLVSCGLLYADSDAADVTDTNTLQAWISAVTANDGSSGYIRSSVVAAAQELRDKPLRITQIDVIGLPKQPAAAPAPAPAAAANSFFNSGAFNSFSGGQKKPNTPHESRTSMEAWRGGRPAVSVSAASGSKPADQAEYDSVKGVMHITGLDLAATEPFTINWHLT